MKTIYYNKLDGRYYEDVNCTRECQIFYTGEASGEAGGAIFLLLVAMLLGAYYIVPIMGVVLAFIYRERIDYWARGMFLCAYAFSVVEGMLHMRLPTINPFLVLSVYYWCINLLEHPKRTRNEWIIDLIVVLFPFLDPVIRGVMTWAITGGLGWFSGLIGSGFEGAPIQIDTETLISVINWEVKALMLFITTTIGTLLFSAIAKAEKNEKTLHFLITLSIIGALMTEIRIVFNLNNFLSPYFLFGRLRLKTVLYFIDYLLLGFAARNFIIYGEDKRERYNRTIGRLLFAISAVMWYALSKLLLF